MIKLFKCNRGRFTVKDLALALTVYKVREEIRGANQYPGSDYWILEPNSSNLTDRINEILKEERESLERISGILPERFLKNDILMEFIIQRKSSRGEGDGGPRNQILRIVNQRGYNGCHWRGIFDGECSEELTCDRIKPGSRGGSYIDSNVVIACSKHNNSRRDKLIEECIKDKAG